MLSRRARGTTLVLFKLRNKLFLTDHCFIDCKLFLTILNVSTQESPKNYITVSSSA